MGADRADLRGGLKPGDKLPSVRELAVEAGVNVNTVRAVYARLESQGLIRSEQGRGTFVTEQEEAAAASDAEVRRDLKRRIAMLEAELVRRPQLPAEASAERRGGAGRLASTEELAQIHDDLLGRLQRIDEDRAEILRSLEELRAAAQLEPEPAPLARIAARAPASRARACAGWAPRRRPDSEAGHDYRCGPRNEDPPHQRRRHQRRGAARDAAGAAGGARRRAGDDRPGLQSQRDRAQHHHARRRCGSTRWSSATAPPATPPTAPRWTACASPRWA